MLPVYNSGSEAIETVYTYEEWLKEYNRQEAKQKAKKKRKKEYTYFMKQRLSGLALASIGIVTPFILNGDTTFSLIAFPLGIFLMMTKERVMTF